MRIASIAKLCVCLMLVVFSIPALHAQGTMAPPANETATQFYMRYQGVFAKATKIEQLLPMMNADMVKQYNAMPAAQKSGMLEMIKMMSSMNSNLKVTKETVTPKGTVLTLTAVDSDKKPQYGTVTIVKEGGAWKTGPESWTNVAPK